MSITRSAGLWIAKVSMVTVLITMLSARATAARSDPDVPRLEIRNGVMTWVNAKAFKPIPAALLKQGEAVCRIFDTATQKHRPAGYHPSALNAEGKPFPGGGYLCVKK